MRKLSALHGEAKMSSPVTVVVIQHISYCCQQCKRTYVIMYRSR